MHSSNSSPSLKRRLAGSFWPSVLLALCLAAQTRGNSRALVVGGIGAGTVLRSQVAARIVSAGYTVRSAPAESLTDLSNVDLLVLVDAARLPAAAGRPIERFLRGGGDLIALRAPLWQTPLVEAGGRWFSADDFSRATAARPPEHLLFGFQPGSIRAWDRTANSGAAPSFYSAGAHGPAAHTYSLHAYIPNLTGWDTLAIRNLVKPFLPGQSFTVFSAKGGPRTSRLAFEWDEKDGSRWIATVALGRNWRRYMLKPEDFKYWQSNPHRGGRGDRFNSRNAVMFSVGLAFSHTGPLPGSHEFWVGPVGTSNLSGVKGLLHTRPDIEPLDLLTPAYKFFECTGVAAVASSGGADLPVHGRILSPQPRPEGRGFGKGRTWRFIPLATATTTHGEWRGTPAALLLHRSDSRFNGGVWAAFGYQEPSVYSSPAVLSLIEQTAERIRTGVFLLEGGTGAFTYFAGNPITFGARVLNLTRNRALGLRVVRQLIDPGTRKVVWSSVNKLELEGKQSSSVESPVDLPGGYSWPKRGLIASTRLFLDGKLVDEISHEVHLWTPPARKQFVTAHAGQFWLAGTPWKAHGVNYMPSSGIGTEDGNYFEHWLGARAYDPVIIQRDLNHIKDLGLNAVSVFTYSQDRQTGNLLDLLRRCANLGLKANVSLRPGTPMHFQWDKIRSIIERYRLWDNDTVFAYDLAWEPSFGGYQARKQWDESWAKWIRRHYGTVEHAEANWGFPVPKANGNITGLSDAQLVTKGKWGAMVAAYRRFLDDLLYQHYQQARQLIRTVDSNHLVSFRMSEAGDPTYNGRGFLPYDLAGVAPAVDFLAPEAYGRISDRWERVRPGWFERAYARWAAPNEPMVWAEVGVSAWDKSRMHDRAEKLEYQADYFRQFYRMLIASGANGVFFWWYPGGFRYGENSDYGIINPDGSDRPATEVIRRNAKAFLTAPPALAPNAWIEIDRDADPRGIYGIYAKVGEEFWDLIGEGKTPGLRTAGTGTTSANCPLVAVGNTRYDGHVPLKYLNAVFDRLEVRDAVGRWVPAKAGARIEVSARRSVVARATVRNLGEARWLAGQTPGSVELVCQAGKANRHFPLPRDVNRGEAAVFDHVPVAGLDLRAPVEARFSLRARDRAEFGESVRLEFVPAR